MSSQLGIPCNGRPVGLGMLYNCFTDTFIQGRSLWSLEVLKKGIQKQNATYKDEEGFPEKDEDKNAGACKNAEKLVENSCIDNNADIKKYSDGSTHTELLILDCLGPIQYPQALKDATHVVTALAYGQTDTAIVYINKDSRSGAAVDSAREEEESSEKNRALHNSTSYDPSCQVKSKLKIVPKVAYVTPISVLTSEQLELNFGLQGKVKAILTSFDDAEKCCNKLQGIDSYQKFVNIKKQISTFLRLLESFKQTFKQKIEINKKGLENWIASVESSPFSPGHIANFLTEKEQELNKLSQHIKNADVEGILFDFPGYDNSLDMLTADSDLKYVVCFAFQVTSDTHTFLHKMEKYSMELINTDTYGMNTEAIPEFNEGMIRTKLCRFVEFAKANSKTNNLAFVVKEKVDTKSTEPAILIFENGILLNIQLPGKPVIREVSAESSKIKLKWAPPEDFGPETILDYKIKIICKPKGLLWMLRGPYSVTHESKDTEMSIDKLSSNTEYTFTIQARITVGYSPESEPCVKTLPWSWKKDKSQESNV